MARLRSVDGREERLRADTLVGRSRRADVTIRDGWVSAEHARFRWAGTHWEVRDLNSRNGTFLSSRRLGGDWEPITPGDLLGFGRVEAPWLVADVLPPGAWATAGDARVEAEEGVVALPGDDAALLYQRDDGAWVVEQGATSREAHDLDEVTVAGTSWTLHVPEVVEATRDAQARLVGASRVVFRVSLDEEHIEIELHGPHGVDRLPHRAHHEVLLTLARERLADADDASVPASEQGWRYQDDLAKQLRIRPLHFNMSIHRARHQLREVGFVDADAILERRRGAGQIRLGVGEIEVERST